MSYRSTYGGRTYTILTLVRRSFRTAKLNHAARGSWHVLSRYDCFVVRISARSKTLKRWSMVQPNRFDSSVQLHYFTSVGETHFRSGTMGEPFSPSLHPRPTFVISTRMVIGYSLHRRQVRPGVQDEVPAGHY